MFSEELNKLIEASLVDGVITEKERAVIHKRAQLEGVDPDEVDMILDAELHKLSQNIKPSKQGVIKKCPSCGAIYEAGSVKCSQCGYLFVDIEGNKSAIKLSNKLNEIQKNFKVKNNEGNIDRGKLDAELALAIQTFPVPSAKDDLLEFIPSMETKWVSTDENWSNNNQKLAYKAKYYECLDKAKVLFGKDPQFQYFFNQEEKKKNSWERRSFIQKFFIIWFGIMLLAGLWALVSKLLGFM